MNPFYSIIVPTFNVEDTLSIALQSILVQSFKDFEIIIMDGLSTDDTLKIVNNFSKSDNRIKIYSEQDNGIYDAMNKAILKSNGDYLFFLGSDDQLYNSFVLEKIYDSLKTNKVDVIYGNVHSTRFKGIYDGLFDAKKLFKKNICHQSIFFNKSIFKITGLFDLKFKAHADYDHNIKWFFNKKISHRYENLIISEYADGGFSSINGDPIFAKNKKNIFLKNAYKNIELSSYFKFKYPKLFAFLRKLKSRFRVVKNE